VSLIIASGTTTEPPVILFLEVFRPDVYEVDHPVKVPE
jgi:hypothetical protein